MLRRLLPPGVSRGRVSTISQNMKQLLRYLEIRLVAGLMKATQDLV
jgi:hypothetical protein